MKRTGSKEDIDRHRPETVSLDHEGSVRNTSVTWGVARMIVRIDAP